VPDPRIAGPNIYFDTRMDSANETPSKDPLLQAMGERQRRAGSIQSTESPEYMQPKSEDAPSFRSGFKPNSEALYVPKFSVYGDLSPKDLFLHETVERYNIVNDFLNTLKSAETRDFAQHLIIKLLPCVNTNDLSELDSLLHYVSRALSSHSLVEDNSSARLTQFKPINDYLSSLGNSSEASDCKEFATYLASRLLPDSKVDETEMSNVISFLQQHVAKCGQPLPAVASNS